MGGSCDGVCVQPSCEQSVLGVCACVGVGGIQGMFVLAGG